MHKIRRGALAVVGALLLLLGGCASPGPNALQAPAPYQPDDVTIQPGDSVEIKFFTTPELNDQQIVRPGGRVTLHLVGDVCLLDMTPQEAAQAVEKSYQGLLRKPRVVVIIRGMPERKVFVGGEVLSPGPVHMPGNLTALEAVMAAGGFNSATAEPARVIVIRHENGQRLGATLDLSRPLDGKASEPFTLKPRDIVYVPKSFIADVNQWIDQHINKIIPEVGYSFGRSSTRSGQTTSHTMDLKKN